MELDSVRELKLNAFKALASQVESIITAAAVQRIAPRRFMAVGIAPSEQRDGYKLAIRLQRDSSEANRALERLKSMAKGEVDVQYIGAVRTAAVAPNAAPTPPALLRLGSSIAHYRVTAGTLGAFVKSLDVSDHSIYVLSNNHVIANTNKCKLKDDILGPSPLDGGKRSKDRIGGLSDWVVLRTNNNEVDCAIAALDQGDPGRGNDIAGVGKLAGISAGGAYDGLKVSKRGRTTALTHGTVTAFEVDDVVVSYPTLGNISFDGQIEVEGIGKSAFAAGGDSGSLVVDGERQAIGLLFATSEKGGSNQKGLTYVNPITPVLEKLNIEFL